MGNAAKAKSLILYMNRYEIAARRGYYSRPRDVREPSYEDAEFIDPLNEVFGRHFFLYILPCHFLVE